MALDADDEILHDFLTEAGELLEGLNDQLVELEQRPDDQDLLNAAFRAFHTIKGGAGFVGLDPLVRLCHVAEDVFNALRNREIAVDAGMMDLLLQALDVVNEQFADARAQRMPEPAPEPLVLGLEALLTAPSPAPAAIPPEPEADLPVARTPGHQDTDALDPADLALEELLAGGAEPAVEDDPSPDTDDTQPAPAGGASDTIDDDEFEALLDNLHGAGQAPGAAEHGDAQEPAGGDAGAGESTGVQAPAAPAPAAPASPPADDARTSPASSSPRSADRTPSGGEDTVRVDVRRLDEIMNLVGELVLVRNRLTSFQALGADPDLARIAGGVDRVTADMQTAVMASRLQPVRRAFSRFPRLVRDLARDLGKDVHLVMEGAETELDKNLVDALSEPLVHLVRNAVDHGVETPEARVAAGKPREGTVTLTARHGGDHVLVMVAEDGAGMDPEAIRQRAVNRGLISAEQSARMKDADACQLVFEPGFSTRDAISDVSGRGVGMDVVKTRIGQLNGSVEIDSTLGEGSCFSIRLPLTLAILPTLMVRVADQRFALPLSNVVETYEFDPSRRQDIDGQPVLVIRREILPLHHGRQLLGYPDAQGPQHVVAMNVDNRRVGLVVDDLIGKEEVVVKPLGVFVRDLPGLSGATITGDGRIAIILDAADLIRRAGAHLREPIALDGPEPAEEPACPIP